MVERADESVGSEFELTSSPVDIAGPNFKKFRPIFRQTLVPILCKIPYKSKMKDGDWSNGAI